MNNYTLPKQVFDINTILYGQTTLEDGINILSNMPSEELYSVFKNAKDISFATKLMEKLPEDAFNNLRTFMETSEKIDRSKTSYLFLKENMKTVIKHKNSLIEGLIKKIEASRRKEETIKKATEYFNVPLVAMANYDNQKRKG